MRPDSSLLNPDFVGWSLYLGASWTWCIGMFLPVLLVRDYGLWAFVIFALPNVIGAAVMGWIVKSAAASEKFLADHALAAGAFSLVTICFHGFFLGWISSRLLAAPAIFGGCILAAAAVMFFLMRALNGVERWLAALTMLASWIAFVVLIKYRQQSLGVWLPESRAAAPLDLISLSAVCVLGFALCPYLDRTFHLARQSMTNSATKWGFGIGFGVVFCSMIIFTLLYSDLIFVERVDDAILTLIVAHMAGQAAFTTAAHGAVAQKVWRGLLMVALAAGCFAAGMYADLLGYQNIAGFEMRGGEIGYRLFMSFYGLLAPAYVWICSVRWERPVKSQWIILSLSITAALPFYWLGFIEMQMAWAGIGAMIVVLARVLVSKSARN